MSVCSPSAAQSSTLRDFYATVVRPLLQKSGRSKTHLEIHEGALARFENFLGREISPAEVNDELLTRFEGWLWRTVTSDNRRRNLVESIRRIVGFYDPNLKQNRRCRRPLPDPVPGTLRHFYETVYVSHRLCGRPDRTIEEYRTVMFALHQHYRRDVLLSECTDDLAADHFRWLMQVKRLSPPSVNRHRGEWFAIWNYGFKLGHVDAPPRLRKYPELVNEPDAWSKDQVERILQSVDAVRGDELAKIQADLWFDAALRVVWYTALRRGTLLGLKHADVDRECGKLVVPASLMKNRRGQKFKLGPDALEAIDAIWNPSRELLFPIGDVKRMYGLFNLILAKAGIPPSTSKLGYFHKLRRSTATKVANIKGPLAASELLGHKSEFVTQRYIDRSQLDGHDFSDVLALGPRAGRPPAAAAG